MEGLFSFSFMYRMRKSIMLTKYNWCRNVLLCLALILLFVTPSFAGEKLKVAVSDLDAFGVSPDLANSISDLLRTELFRTGYFHVMERKQMTKILEEQAFQLSGATENDIVELGRVLAVQLMAMGSMNRLGKQLVINIRLVDVEEARLKAAETVTAYGEEELSNAVKTMAKKISESVPLRGKVVGIKADEIIVSMGSMDQVIEGTTLRVQRWGEIFKDPATGKTLGREVIEVALLRVEKVIGEQLSMTRILEDYSELQVGDIVVVWTGKGSELPGNTKITPEPYKPPTTPAEPSQTLPDKRKRVIPSPGF